MSSLKYLTKVVLSSLLLFVSYATNTTGADAVIDYSNLGPVNQHQTPTSSSILPPQQQQLQMQQQQLQLQQLSVQLNPYTKANFDILLELRQQMLSRSIKFDEHFRSLLKSTKNSLHNMFVDTYGKVYISNAEIFTGLFDNLEQYYGTGERKLTKLMEDFFEQLYQKVFQVFNQNRHFPPGYLECITKQLNHLKPFKEIPDRLMSQMRHVFVAARTFNQALNYGIDIIKHIVVLGQPPQCNNLIAEKLLKNPLANSNEQQTSPDRLPCLSLCESVMTKCMGRTYLDQLNDHWQAYVQSLGELATKLSTDYDIETVISSMDVQISEAVMNFQENGTNITNSVYTVCGSPSKPTSMRLGKRAAARPPPKGTSPIVPSRRQSQSVANFNLGGHLRASSSRNRFVNDDLVLPDLKVISQKSPSIIGEIKGYMSSTKFFWNNLPNAVCSLNNSQTSSSSSNKKNQQNNNCFQEQLGLANINYDIRYRKEILGQVGRLVSICDKIRKALDGDEIDWSSNSLSDSRPVPNVSGRLPISTSSSTTTPDPIDEDEEPDEEDPSIEGSGSSSLESSLADNLEDPTDQEDEDYPTQEENSDDSLMSSTTETSVDQNIDILSQDKNSVLGQPTFVDDSQFNLITPPTQADAQKSSQTSSKLVIRFQDNIILLLLTGIASLIVISNIDFNRFPSGRILR